MSTSGTIELPIDRPEFGVESAGTPCTFTVLPDEAGSTPSARTRTCQGLWISVSSALAACPREQDMRAAATIAPATEIFRIDTLPLYAETSERHYGE